MNNTATKRRPRMGLGIPLEERLPPSRRHPSGAPRCQAATWRDGEPRQCQRAARDGLKVCGHHGGGFRKREREGIAQNPAVARLTTGARAQPATLAQHFRDHPEVRVLYEHHLNDSNLLDTRPLLAQAKTISDSIIRRIDFAAPDGQGGSPSAFKAIQALGHVTRMAHDMIRIEEHLGPVTHAELGRLTDAVAHTIRTFVPTERHEEAFALLRSLIGGGHRGTGRNTGDASEES